MIDSSIYKVYKENQQVFIPEFGAIIQSEVSDSPTFNDMLNFDDGKVVEAIMEKEGIGEDEARTQLQEHVQLIKDKIQEGKTHYVRGLGHIYKDEFGSYAVSKKKPSLDFTAATEAEQPADDASLQDNVPGEFESSLDSTDSFSLDNSTTEEFTIEDPVEPESDFSSLIENADNDLEQNLESEGENQFDLASVNSDDQFNIPEDSDSSDFDQDSENESWNDDNEEYSYDEESFDDDDSYDSDTFYKEEGKGNKVFIV